MKLAEALSIRKDLQKCIQQLEQRIKNNVKVHVETKNIIEYETYYNKLFRSC
jgi:hypothetical protein